MGFAEAKTTKGAVFDMMIKPSSLREELAMSFRTIVSIAASVMIGIACVATVSTDTFAKSVPAGTTRLEHKHHYHHTVHHSGAVRYGSPGNAK